MRKPKIGDKLVISEYYDENEERIIDSEKDRPRMAVVEKVVRDGVFADDILNDYSYQILVGFPDSLDKWEFAEESSHTEKEVAKEVCGDICDSYNDVVEKDDVEPEYVPQSFSDFNASSGGGKTLKDYTGVGFTKDELAFKSSHEKAIESLTADSLAFSPIESDIVNHPSHYNRYSREVIESIKGLCTPEEFRGYLKGNIIKYSARYPDKGGIQDIDKLAKYTQFLKEFEIEMEAVE